MIRGCDQFVGRTPIGESPIRSDSDRLEVGAAGFLSVRRTTAAGREGRQRVERRAVARTALAASAGARSGAQPGANDQQLQPVFLAHCRQRQPPHRHSRPILS